MLEASHLTKHYDGVVALDDLNLTVDSGEVFCLLGANGAGKTTTIYLFLGLVEPTAGAARVNGSEVGRGSRETRRHLAYIPEQVNLYKNLSGLENLAYFSALAGGPELDRRSLLFCLEQVGLPGEAARRRVSTYSKGMRQKVGIAIALAKQAAALLLDEPTSGLDPQAANELGRLVRELSERGMAVLMATHDLFRAKEVGHRAGIMKHGRLRATLPTAGLDHAQLERIYLEHMHD